MHLNARQPWSQDHDYSSMPLPSPPSSSPTPSSTTLPFSMPPSPTTTSHHNPTSSLPNPLELLCPPSQPQAETISHLNGFPAHPALPAHLSLPTQPIPQHCLPSEALTLPHPPPRLAEMVCNIADFSNMMQIVESSIADANNIDQQPSPCPAPSPCTPSSPFGPAASPEAIASSAIAELTELTELEPAPAWGGGGWEPAEQQDILSSAMAALSDMLDSPECNSALQYNCSNFPNNLPTTSNSSFGYSNFHSSSSPSYNYPSQSDTGCYGMKTEAGMYGLKTEVCYGVKTETECYGGSPKQQASYGGLSNTTTTSSKENFGGLSVKESYGLSPTSVLDYGSPPSSPSSTDGWPMGE